MNGCLSRHHNPILNRGVLITLFLFQIASAAALNYTTSWIGNTFGGKGHKWVQDFMDNMFTDADGTCYVESGWDEGGRDHGMYKDGDVLGLTNETMNHNRDVDSYSAGGYKIELEPRPTPKYPVQNDTRVLQWGKITGNGKTISDPAVFPHAICMGTGVYKDKLLVADWGPSQQIVVYDLTQNPPKIVDRIGAPGGIAASFISTYNQPIAKNSPVPFPVGEYAPGVYHPLKFWGVTGIGMDSKGRLFVCTSENGAMIRCFNQVGENWMLDWQLINMCFIDVASYDPASDEVYASTEHYKMDWSKKGGDEWSLYGYTVDVQKHRNDGRWLVDIKGGGEYMIASTVYRNIGGRRMFYTCGMTGGATIGWRFLEGTDIAVPNVQVSTLHNIYWGGDVVLDWPPNIPYEQHFGNRGLSYQWGDLNGDGEYDNNEYFKPTHGYKLGAWIDSKGNIWDNSGSGSIICRKFGGFRKNGSAIYDDAQSEEITIEGLPGNTSRVMYEEETDRMVFVVGGADRRLQGGSIHSIENWSKGNRTARSQNHTLNVEECSGDQCAVSSVTVLGRYLFEVQYETKAKVRIWDLDNNCAEVGALMPGPEIEGKSGTIDICYGVLAHRRPNGEILVFVENNWMSNVIMYRWTPPNVTLLPEDTIPPAPITGLVVVPTAEKVSLTWTPGTEKNLTYFVYRGKTPGVTTKFSEKIAHGLPTASFDDIQIEAGTTYFYQVTAVDNFGNESNSSTTAVKAHIKKFQPVNLAQSDIDIYTMQGRKVSMHSRLLSTKNLKSGCFIAASKGSAVAKKNIQVVPH